MKKRISALCAALALILSLAACGSANHDTPIPDYDEDEYAPSADVPAETTKPDDGLPEQGTDEYWFARAAALDETNALQTGTMGDQFNWYYDGEVLAVRGAGLLEGQGTIDSFYAISDNLSYVLRELSAGDATVVIEDGCIAMGGVFFIGSDSILVNIVIADSVKFLDGTFYTCSNLRTLTLPQSVIIVGHNTFKECSSLAELTMPDDLIFMSADAFDDCRSLNQIHWRGETYSSPDAFLEAVKAAGIPTEGETPTIDYDTGVVDEVHIRLEEDTLYVSGTGTVHKSDVGNASAANVVIEPGVTHIDSEVFNSYASSGQYKLTSVTLPDGLKSIGDKAFSGSDRLVSINLPDSLESIGAQAFTYCKGLTSLTLPSGLKSIGAKAFDGCEKLTFPALPDGLESIGAAAFSSCYGLTSIVIPDSVTTMGGSVFSGCLNLTEVTLGRGVTQFDGSWFNFCSSLTKVKAPSSMQEDVLKSGMDISIFEWY